MQWIFLASTGTVSRVVGQYQRQHQVILPCLGTVLDMGHMLTRKDLVIRLHVQGLCALEIARQTHHRPPVSGRLPQGLRLRTDTRPIWPKSQAHGYCPRPGGIRNLRVAGPYWDLPERHQYHT
ncbi:MAG: DUF1670 domain-containing protein [Clostridia bacterium]|nr:DUF1670 domain-containing protein [Clostridia bacterium]